MGRSRKRYAPATFPFTARKAPSDAAFEYRPLAFLHHKQPGCASFRCDPIIRSNLPSSTRTVRIHLSRALSGPKLAMFQVSGDARINHVGLVEVEAGKAKREIFRSSDGRVAEVAFRY
jgi:hypothetical protein